MGEPGGYESGTTPAEAAGGVPEFEMPSWVSETIEYAKGFYKEALTNRKFPFTVDPKQISKIVNNLGTTLLDTVSEFVNEPYDAFQLPYQDYIETAWQSTLDWAQKFKAEKYDITKPTTEITERGEKVRRAETEISEAEREAFAEYEPQAREHFEALAKGKGYAMEEMEAMFRTELKDINTKTEQRIAAVNRLSSSDPRLRKSALMDLEVAKGEWVQTARDKNMVRQAEMRIKSEFFGAEGLMELAKVAIGEEVGFNKLNFIANELNLNKDQLNINADLAVAAIVQRAEGMGLEKDRLTMEADRMLAEIGQRGESLEMQAQGLGMAAGQMAGQQAGQQQNLWFNQKALQQQQIAQQSGVFQQAQDMFRWGRNYQLSAAGAASGLAGAGMNMAANVYGTQADPAWYTAPQEYVPNPIWGVLGAGIGAAGAVGGGWMSQS